METNQNLNQEEVYEKPAIEVIEMESEGSILVGSDFGGGGGFDGW